MLRSLAEILENTGPDELPLLRGYLSQFSAVRAKGENAVLGAISTILASGMRQEFRLVLIREILNGC